MTVWDKMTDLERRAMVHWRILNRPWYVNVPPDWDWPLFGAIVEAMRGKGFLYMNWEWTTDHEVIITAGCDADGQYSVADHPAKAAAEAALRVVAPELFEEN